MIRSRPGERTGTLTACVLVCLVVAATVMAVTVRAAIQARRQTRLEHQLIQTEWLLDAGVRRANAKLSRQADYDGETWNPVGGLQTFGNATVEISVVDASPGIRVKVTATIANPSTHSKTTRRSHEYELSTRNADTSTAESTNEEISS